MSGVAVLKEILLIYVMHKCAMNGMGNVGCLVKRPLN